MLTFDQGIELLKVAFVAGASMIAIGRFLQRVEPSQTKQQGTYDYDELKALIIAVKERQTSLDSRMDKAGKEISDWTSKWQGFESRMRDIFPDKSVCLAQMHESETDRRRMNDDIQRLWRAVGRRRDEEDRG